MKIRERFAMLRANSFVKSVGILISGTVLAQAIMALTLPILTRLYTPSDFNLLAVFVGLVAMVSPAACLRFDVAVPIPRREVEAANVLALALLCCSAVSIILAAGLLGAPEWVVSVLNQPGLQPVLWLVPVSILLAGVFSALQSWFVRRKAFAAIARSRIAQAGAASSTQIGFGWLSGLPIGLILGQVLNSGVGCLGLGWHLIRGDKAALRAITLPRMRAVFRSHSRFPKYSALEALSNSASMQIPIIMIAALTVGPEAGYLLLALYVMQAPMGLIGSAVAQVYLSRAPDEYRAGRLGAFTADVIAGLVRTGVGPLLFAGIVAPDFFAIVFGQDWQRAGYLVLWMTPWFVMQFLSAPVSMALHVTGRQRAALILQLFGLLLRVAAVYAVSRFAAERLSEVYALSGFAFYLIYLVVVLRVVGAGVGDVARDLQRALPSLLAWAATGGVIAAAALAVRQMLG